MNRFIAAAIGGLTVDTAPLAALSGTGWRALVVEPSPYAMRTLGRGGTSRRTQQGEASVSWWAGGGTVAALRLAVPPASTAAVRLPLLLDEHGPGAAESASDRRVVAGGCSLSCSGLLGDAAGEGDCEAYSAARCERRHDGEVVLALQVASGVHAFDVHRS